MPSQVLLLSPLSLLFPSLWLPGRNHLLSDQGTSEEDPWSPDFQTSPPPPSTPVCPSTLGKAEKTLATPVVYAWGAPSEPGSPGLISRSASPEPQMDVGATAQCIPPSCFITDSWGCSAQNTVLQFPPSHRLPCHYVSRVLSTQILSRNSAGREGWGGTCETKYHFANESEAVASGSSHYVFIEQ